MFAPPLAIDGRFALEQSANRPSGSGSQEKLINYQILSHPRALAARGVSQVTTCHCTIPNHVIAAAIQRANVTDEADDRVRRGSCADRRRSGYSFKTGSNTPGTSLGGCRDWFAATTTTKKTADLCSKSWDHFHRHRQGQSLYRRPASPPLAPCSVVEESGKERKWHKKKARQTQPTKRTTSTTVVDADTVEVTVDPPLN